jgi:hypothetical protein
MSCTSGKTLLPDAMQQVLACPVTFARCIANKDCRLTMQCASHCIVNMKVSRALRPAPALSLLARRVSLVGSRCGLRAVLSSCSLSRISWLLLNFQEMNLTCYVPCTFGKDQSRFLDFSDWCVSLASPPSPSPP